MSRLDSQTFACTSCGAGIEMAIVSSINADRRGDLRAAVVDDSYQRGSCPSCLAPYRVEPELTYLDAAQGLWVLVRPARLLADWAPLEQVARQAFERAHGDTAPAMARELGARLRPRVVFGWAALREKLLCAQHGLDDVVLELLKLALMRTASELDIGDDLELRLVGVDGPMLSLAWLQAQGDAVIERLEVPRQAFDDIAADASGAWAELRADLGEGLFVDVNRLLVPAEDDEAA
ncbi:MAG: CpXC domain-containing protein [Piscinibacter sp.]|nr:CpXC domain-containing protein [Piscinibacter sp.]